jgi:hypothetical protein
VVVAKRSHSSLDNIPQRVPIFFFKYFIIHFFSASSSQAFSPASFFFQIFLCILFLDSVLCIQF